MACTIQKVGSTSMHNMFRDLRKSIDGLDWKNHEMSKKILRERAKSWKKFIFVR